MTVHKPRTALSGSPENKRRRTGIFASFLAVVLLCACSPQAGPSWTVPPGSTPSTAPADTTTTAVDEPTTTGVTSTTTPTAEQTLTLALYPFANMGPRWTEQVFPYGETEETLGTSPGGEGLMFGPDYGVQAKDGTWWFLDAAKKRLAHFAADGTYIDQVLMPEDLLVDGIYFQYQMPQPLTDGSIVATGWREGETTSLLRIRDGMATGISFGGAVAWVTTDGSYLYGHTLEDNAPHWLDPSDPIDWFVARDGVDTW
jgi:hypothetical protein